MLGRHYELPTSQFSIDTNGGPKIQHGVNIVMFSNVLERKTQNRTSLE